MTEVANRNIKLAYKILDHIAHCEENGIDLTTKKVVTAVAKIIEGFDGRETMELKHTTIHSGYLRGVRRT